MVHAPLIDTQGRTVRDLRISVTDRCNLRCVYCMPAEGMPWLAKDDLLSYEEIVRFSRVSLSLGVTGIRLTGGEPTVRMDLPVLVRMLNQLAPDLDLSMTTNGLKLTAMAENHTDFILGLNPIADFRHQALDLAGMLRGDVLSFRAICDPVV